MRDRQGFRVIAFPTGRTPARERDLEERLGKMERWVEEVWNDPLALMRRLYELAAEGQRDYV